jgi:cysteine-rich repeat protein
VPGYDCQGGNPFRADQCFDKCGDGIILASSLVSAFYCDDGNNLPGDGCGATCYIEDGYTCVSSTTAASVCIEVCGDGSHMGTDTCDDANTVSGDGCDNNCMTELGWSCG